MFRSFGFAFILGIALSNIDSAFAQGTGSQLSSTIAGTLSDIVLGTGSETGSGIIPLPTESGIFGNGTVSDTLSGTATGTSVTTGDENISTSPDLSSGASDLTTASSLPSDTVFSSTTDGTLLPPSSATSAPNPSSTSTTSFTTSVSVDPSSSTSETTLPGSTIETGPTSPSSELSGSSTSTFSSSTQGSVTVTDSTGASGTTGPSSTDSLSSTEAPPVDTQTPPGTTEPPPESSSESEPVPSFVSSEFVVSDSITIPPQTAFETGEFETITVPDITGPPNSFSATTTQLEDDDGPTILPVWFDDGGRPIIVIPTGPPGPPGIIPPPAGFPGLIIGPGGNPTPNPPGNNPPDNPDPTTNDPTNQPTQTEEPTTTDEPSSTTDSSSTSSSSSSSSSSSEPTAAPTQCIIVANQASSGGDRDSFSSRLSESVGGDNIQTSDGESSGIVFWRAPLNSTQQEEFSTDPAVDVIIPDEILEVEDIADPVVAEAEAPVLRRSTRTSNLGPSGVVKRAPTDQPLAPTELAIISQPRSQPVIPFEYEFDDTAGRGITIYVLDSGANPSHNEYTGMPGTKRWMFPGFGPTPDTGENDPRNHGTCVLGKANSPTFGVAKNSDIVNVKLQADISGGGFRILTSTLADALVDVRNDIEDHGLQGRSIINLSFGIQLDDDRSRDWIRSLLQQILRLGVPMTVASGNSAQDQGRTEVDRYPALFADQLPGLMVVGAVDNAGNRAVFSQGGSLVRLYAPGLRIECPPNTGTDTPAQIRSGTSFAAPAVAGLGAYFMGLPGNGLGGNDQLPANLQRLLESLAYPRASGSQDAVVYNNMNANACTGNAKRQVDGGEACTPSSSQSATTETSSATSGPPSTTLVTSVTSSSSLSETPPETTTEPTPSSEPTPAEPSASCAPTDSPYGGVEVSDIESSVDWICSTISSSTESGECETDIDGITFTSDDSLCGTVMPSVSVPYYRGATTMTLNMTIIEGSSVGVTTQTCRDSFAAILACPPTEAPEGEDLIKYGGSIVVEDDNGRAQIAIQMSGATTI